MGARRIRREQRREDMAASRIVNGMAKRKERARRDLEEKTLGFERLEREILPWVAAHFSRILFVGTASYTYHYEKLFRRGQYTTIDLHPSTAVWGARDHIVGDLRRRRGAIPARPGRPVPHELLVEARLRTARLVLIGGPEAR